MTNLEEKDIEVGHRYIEETKLKMPGMAALREHYLNDAPLKNLRISGSLDVSPSIAVTIEVLMDLGADVRWVAYQEPKSNATVLKALQNKYSSIFSCSVENKDRDHEVVNQSLTFAQGKLPHFIIDQDKSDILYLRSDPSWSDKKTKDEMMVSQMKINLLREEKIERSWIQVVNDIRSLANWEGLVADAQQDGTKTTQREIYVSKADPMLCHCASVVMLKGYELFREK